MNADLKTTLRNRALQALEQLTTNGVKAALAGDMEAARRSTRALQALEQLTTNGVKAALAGDMEAARRSTATLSGWHGCSLWLADDDDFAATASRCRIWVSAAIAHLHGNSYVMSDMDKRLAWRDAA